MGVAPDADVFRRAALLCVLDDLLTIAHLSTSTPPTTNLRTFYNTQHLRFRKPGTSNGVESYFGNMAFSETVEMTYRIGYRGSTDIWSSYQIKIDTLTFPDHSRRHYACSVSPTKSVTAAVKTRHAHVRNQPM